MREAYGYSKSVMSDVLGLLGMVVFIAVIVALAASVTWLVVRFSPAPGKR
jgi:hypothetical protein